jgi:flavorubredoxin
MKPIEIADKIYDVGVIDWNIRDFHGYSTELGTSYNAFLVVDEKTVLIDSVKKDFSDELIHNISKIVDPRKIDMVISNHTEMDHSGSLPRIMHRIGEDKPVYCSSMGVKNLSRHFPQKLNYKPIKNGETLSIGKRSFTFLETKMLHWPDSMFTYLNEDKILFASDAFGQHYAGCEEFDDEADERLIMLHAKKYFANILLLYAPLILNLVEKVLEMGLEFKMICPDHGILWRKNPNKIIEAYVKWSKQIPDKKAVVIYDTMWHSTQLMAEAIAEGIHSQNVSVKPMKLREFHRSDIMTEVLESKAVVVGSPTLNNGLFPTLADFLTYMKGLRPKNKIGAAFGSYGWSGEAVGLVQKHLEEMQFKIIESGMKHQYVPDSNSLEACREMGRKIGQAVIGDSKI